MLDEVTIKRAEIGCQAGCIAALYSHDREIRLSELLTEGGMGQSELARRSGVSFVTINRMCSNLTAGVSLHTLDKLANVLGVRPGDLIGDASPAKSKRAR